MCLTGKVLLKSNDIFGHVQTADKSVCFSDLLFNTDCPHCYLQEIRLDLLCPDIKALYSPISMGCYGNDILQTSVYGLVMQLFNPEA